MIERTFTNIPEGNIEKADEQSYLISLGYYSGISWEKLLLSKRILIVSEAGSGKTYECQTQCNRLKSEGEAAFFLELAELSKGNLVDTLSSEEEERFEQWLSSQSEIATFFLDSIDELKLSLGSFEQALKKFEKSIKGQLDRARVVITTRPIPFDEELVRRLLPVPKPIKKVDATAETFAQIALHGPQEKKSDNQDNKASPDWNTVALLPLSDPQIVEFARLQEVEDPEDMLADLKRRNAEVFARRPQDLIELSADWRDHKRIRNHKEQVVGNIRIKLSPREDREEPADLSVEKAIEGASRLALAMMMTRRLTIRHSAEADKGRMEAAFDPKLILPDWTKAERKALLERPLFGFASYGRVRFHHRSVMEFLASERLLALQTNGMPIAALNRLIFIQTKGNTIVRHSKRAIAGWLALSEPMIFETLRDNEPDVLLNEGDPESLTIQQRIQSLRAFVNRHRKGGWRGINVPNIQIHRFAAVDLAEEIKLLWHAGIENFEIRELLLQLIEHGQITECSDIAYSCASNPQLGNSERLAGLNALEKLNDERLPNLVEQIANNSSNWSEKLIRISVMRFFPRHMSIAQLFKILPRLKPEEGQIGDLSWHLPVVIEKTEWDVGELEAIRDGLTNLISKDLLWEKEWPHFFSTNSHLSELLASTCIRGLEKLDPVEWIPASIIALLFADSGDNNNKIFMQLTQILNNLSADYTCQLFWSTDALLQSLHPVENSWNRFVETTIGWRIQLQTDRDLAWIKECLADSNRDLADRTMVLGAAIRMNPSGVDWLVHMKTLKSLVSNVPALSAWIDSQVEKSKQSSNEDDWRIKHAERQEEAKRKEANNLASWKEFWRQLSKDPAGSFADDKKFNTIWNLWRAMSRAGSRGRKSGWNRQFIEDYLGKDIADRLRLKLMQLWREDRPTLKSERPDNAKGTYSEKWALGLAGIYAESEDPTWVNRLSPDEALLATRYATVELNNLPIWIDPLVKAYPAEVEQVLGNELIEELNEKSEKHFHSMLLQDIGNSLATVSKLFIPRIKEWLDANISHLTKSNVANGQIERFVQVTQFLVKHGDTSVESHLCDLARKNLAVKFTGPPSRVWLPLLLRYDAKAGIDILEEKLKSITPSKNSKAVSLFVNLFGGRQESINLHNSQFTPSVLLRLIRLVYKHVRPKDDAHHDGSYQPDLRDNAEQVRSNILNALLSAKGNEGWVAKLKLARDPICAHFKDRIWAMAAESWAAEVDGNAFSDEQAIAIDKTGEAPPATNEAIFTLMVDRLEAIDDLLLRDTSPRESWAGINQERVMRREITRELSNLAIGLYTVDQESVTADEKETDIRLRSTMSDHQATIELKLADNRTAEDLLSTIKDQLVTKYMASEINRSGCLLITLANERKWDNPSGGSRISFSELVELLKKRAEEITEEYGGIIRIHIHALDLRPRLLTEAANKKK